MICPKCDRSMVKIGTYRNHRGLFQNYKCQCCGLRKVDLNNPIEEKEEEEIGD